MKASCVPIELSTISRLGKPPRRMLLILVLLPLVSGCLRHWLSHKEERSDPEAAAAHYYEQAVPKGTPCYPGVELEVPPAVSPLTASDPEAAEKWEMTLQEALEIALKNKIVRQLRNGVATAVATQWEPAIAETRILEELARFDATVTFNQFWGTQREQLNNNVSPGGLVATSGSFFRQSTFGGGQGSGFPGTGDVLTFRKLFATGGEATIGFDTEFTHPNIGTRFFDSAWESNLFTTFRQPLLKNAGVDVNRASIVIARLRSDQALWDFQRAVEELVRDVEQKYWELVASQVQLWATDRAMELNLEIVRRLQAQLEAGPGSEGDLALAEVQKNQIRRQRVFALSGEVVVGSRIAGVLAVERQLRGLLGLPPHDGRRIVAVDEPSIAPVSHDWRSIVAEAFTYNPDIQRLKSVVAEQKQALLIAQNGVLPQVDLFVRQQWNGLGDTFQDSVSQVVEHGQNSWTYGVQFVSAFGYRKEAAALQRACLQVAQTKALLRDKGREIQDTLAQNHVQANLHYEAYQRAVSTRMAAERDLRVQKLIFDQGQPIRIERLLDAVRNYAESVSIEVQDKVEYQTALASLEATKGTILRYNNIIMQEGPWNPAAYPQAAAQARERQRAIEWYHKPKPETASETLSVYDGPAPSADPWPEAPAAETISAPAGGAKQGPLEIPLELEGGGQREHGPDAAELVLPVKSESDAPTSPTVSNDPPAQSTSGADE